MKLSVPLKIFLILCSCYLIMVIIGKYGLKEHNKDNLSENVREITGTLLFNSRDGVIWGFDIEKHTFGKICDGYYPTVSKHEDELLFARFTDNENTEILSYDFRKRSITKLLDISNKNTGLAISSDGSRIAYVIVRDGRRMLCVSSKKRYSPVCIDEPITDTYRPSWLNNDLLLEIDSIGITRTSIGAKNYKTLISDDEVRSPSPSPNGEYLAFIKNNYNVLLLSLDDNKDSYLLRNYNYYIDFPCWSPDSKYILIHRHKPFSIFKTLPWEYFIPGFWEKEIAEVVSVKNGKKIKIQGFEFYSPWYFSWIARKL